MHAALIKGHRLAKTITRWCSVLLLFLCIYSWYQVYQGGFEIDLELADDFPLNPYFVVVVFMLFIALLTYLLGFIASCSGYLLLSLFSRDT